MPEFPFALLDRSESSRSLLLSRMFENVKQHPFFHKHPVPKSKHDNYVDEAENKASIEDQAVVCLDVVCIQLGNLVDDGSWKDTQDVGGK